ncbi:MAG: DUF1571 domain-containing protein [Planctomycetaceae bacterium]|nr:DUF1571 domain-containing protein [Planctomycetaceae bacterium]
MRPILYLATLISTAALSQGFLQSKTAAVPTETDRQLSAAVPRTDQRKTDRSIYRELRQRLREAARKAKQVERYSATLEQQVVVDGREFDPERIDIKIRRKPFSVYLRWQEDGQEVLYIEGENDGKLLARPTRGLAAMRGVWELPPDSPHAMKGQRYPVTKLGVENLALMAIDFHNAQGIERAIYQCRSEDGTQRNRETEEFTVTFQPEQGSEFSKSILAFDRKLGLLIGVENFGWNDDGEPGDLVERYTYLNLNPTSEITEEDFSRENPNYSFASR